jgi:transposase-like protein
MNTMNTVAKKRKARRVVSARAKVQAVLTIWSGRRNTSQVCRELGVNWGSLNGWERKGLQGIHKAMGGEELTSPVQGELGRRLEGLLAGLATEKTCLPATLAAENQA